IGAGVLVVSSLLMYLMVELAIDPLEDLRTSPAAANETLIQQRIDQLNLNQPAIVRCCDCLRHVATGDMGMAWTTGRPVKDIVASAIVSTIQLITASTFLAIVLGIGVGIVSALRQYSSFDYLMTFVSFLMYSLPSFWIAVLLKQW